MGVLALPPSGEVFVPQDQIWHGVAGIKVAILRDRGSRGSRFGRPHSGRHPISGLLALDEDSLQR